MTIASKVVSVGTTATQINTAPRDATAGQTLLARIPTDAAVSVFLGGTGVTTSTGVEVKAGESLTVELNRSEELYGIVSSGTVDVEVLEAGI